MAERLFTPAALRALANVPLPRGDTWGRIVPEGWCADVRAALAAAADQLDAAYHRGLVDGARHAQDLGEE